MWAGVVWLELVWVGLVWVARAGRCEGQMRRVESGGGRRGRQRRELLALTRSFYKELTAQGRRGSSCAYYSDYERAGVSWRR